MRKKKFIMLIGVPGSGKSTWIKNYVSDYPTMIISSDKHIEKFAKIDGITYSEAFPKYAKKATELMYKDLDTALKMDFDIIWDQTNLTKKIRSNKLKNIPEGYIKEAIFFEVPDNLEERLKTRVGKYIPDDVMVRMKNDLTIPTTDEGFSKITIISGKVHA